jgi:hypothetical protein
LTAHDTLTVGEDAATNGRGLVVLVHVGDWTPPLEFRTHLTLLPKGRNGIHVVLLKGQPANTILLVGEEFNVQGIRHFHGGDLILEHRVRKELVQLLPLDDAFLLGGLLFLLVFYWNNDRHFDGGVSELLHLIGSLGVVRGVPFGYSSWRLGVPHSAA